jgi:hypothetical protein
MAKVWAKGSVAETIATRLGVRHLFCDPTSAERGTREIPSNKEIRGSHGFPKHPHPEQEDIVKSKSA